MRDPRLDKIAIGLTSAYESAVVRAAMMQDPDANTFAKALAIIDTETFEKLRDAFTLQLDQLCSD